MLVYTAITYYEYEGYSSPLGIFDTYEKAIELRQKLYDKGIYGRIDIFEHELNEPMTGKRLVE